MIKKEMIAMLLAGGQGSRLGVLTSKVAKPAVSFGGKYRIIDFPLSNCINSGVDTVGVLTQYQPLRLNTHIGIGVPWDLDRNIGGVTVLPPYEKSTNSEWYTGTANAIYQNLEYMERFNPEYVLILSGDHIYKMDYEVMLDFHKQNKSECTIAVMPVPMEEAKRFGIMITDENRKITEFEEKPEHPRSNLASMGIYIFNWKTLKEALIAKAVPALREVLIDQEFATCERVLKNIEEFEKSNNPILEFYEELDEADYKNEPIKKVYQRYTSFCISNNLQAMSAIEFQKQMKRQFNVVIKTVEEDGKKVRVYLDETEVD